MGGNLKVWTVSDVERDTIRYPGYDNFIHGTECLPLPLGGLRGIHDMNPKFLHLPFSGPGLPESINSNAKKGREIRPLTGGRLFGWAWTNGQWIPIYRVNRRPRVYEMRREIVVASPSSWGFILDRQFNQWRIKKQSCCERKFSKNYPFLLRVLNDCVL